MVKKRITIIFLVAVTTFSLYLCYIIFRPFLSALLSAVVLAVVFFPVQRRMLRVISSPSLAALLSMALVTVIIIVPAVFIGVAISQEVAGLYQYLDQKSDESGGLSPYLMQLIEKPLGLISQYVDLSQFNLRAWLMSRLQQISSFLLAEVGIVLGNITSFVVNTVITLFTLFFLFREGRTMRRRAAAILPLSTEQVERLFTGIENTIVATVYGGLAVASAQGALTGIALWICGVPSPVLWGVVAAMFSLLPLVGSAVVWVPAALYLIITGSYGYGVFLIIWGALVVGTVDNFLRPYLIGGRVQMHTLLIFFAVFGGVNVFGFLGLFIGPVILAVTTTLLTMLRDEARTWLATDAENGEEILEPAPPPREIAPAPADAK